MPAPALPFTLRLNPFSDLFSEAPVTPGAIALYALVLLSIVLVVYYGNKKPRGPSGAGPGRA